jgi:general secretion pathway protein M
MSRAAVIGWYGQLAPRDQRILRIGAIAVALILLLWIFLPLQRNLNAARSKLQAQQADLEWMRQVGPTLAAAGPGPMADAQHESLAVLIDRSARESGLAQALSGTQPAGNDALRVQLANADFNLLLGWLARLSAQQGVRVEAASITGNPAPGVVNASVQLRLR